MSRGTDRRRVQRLRASGAPTGVGAGRAWKTPRAAATFYSSSPSGNAEGFFGSSGSWRNPERVFRSQRATARPPNRAEPAIRSPVRNSRKPVRVVFLERSLGVDVMPGFEDSSPHRAKSHRKNIKLCRRLALETDPGYTNLEVGAQINSVFCRNSCSQRKTTASDLLESLQLSQTGD